MALFDVFRSASREPSRATLMARGTAFLVGLLLLVVSLYLYGQGTFSDQLKVAAIVDDAGGSLVVGSDVKYDGVVVGKVGAIEFDAVPGGARTTRIDLNLVPGDARHVPADVQARVLPASVFGISFVDLVSPVASGARQASTRAVTTDEAPRNSLREGMEIPQDRSRSTLELQDALDGLDEVITSLGPAQLSNALTALAAALDGNGEQLGATIERLDGYMRKLSPSMPAVRRNLALLNTNLEAFQDYAPDLFAATEHALVVARTLTSQEDDLRGLTRHGATAMGDVDRLLTANERDLVDALVRTAVTVDSLYDGRKDLSQSVLSFLDLAENFRDALSEGRYLKIRGDLVLGEEKPYGPGDCPQYGSLRGRGC